MPKLTDKDLDVVEQLLCARWPKAFVRFEQRRQPLKVGIFNELVAALGDAATRHQLHRTLARYVCNIHYLKRLRPDTPRLDLDGNPAGVVTEQEAEHAKLMLLKRKAKNKKPPPPQPEPHDGLAALREAARQRRSRLMIIKAMLDGSPGRGEPRQ